MTSRPLSSLAASHPIWDSTNCLFSVTWPPCPNFRFHSISNYVLSSCLSSIFFSLTLAAITTFSLDAVGEDVTFSSELTVWGESYYFAPTVWVKSPLTEISDHCLLGSALLRLPHRHTRRAPKHSSASLSHTAQHTLWSRSVIEITMPIAQSLRFDAGGYWTNSWETLKVKLSFDTAGYWCTEGIMGFVQLRGVPY